MNKYAGKDIEVEVEGEVLWIYLNRPEAMNAFSTEMIKSLVRALKNAEQDQSIRLTIISGRGRAFCAGGDIRAMQERTGMFAGDCEELKKRYQEGIQQIPLTIEACQKPILAMINGAAIGAGLDLACMCDLRISSSHAKFGETFTKLALVPGDGGSFFLQRIVGFAKAMEMSLTAKVYNAQEALDMGLVNSLCSETELKKRVQEYIEQILLTAPMASAMTKESLKLSYHQELSPILDLLATYQGRTQRTDDHFEALKAFKEKRKPLWSGK